MKSELNSLKSNGFGFFFLCVYCVGAKKPQQINSERNRNIYNLRKKLQYFFYFKHSKFCKQQLLLSFKRSSQNNKSYYLPDFSNTLLPHLPNLYEQNFQGRTENTVAKFTPKELTRIHNRKIIYNCKYIFQIKLFTHAEISISQNDLNCEKGMKLLKSSGRGERQGEKNKNKNAKQPLPPPPTYVRKKFTAQFKSVLLCRTFIQ